MSDLTKDQVWQRHQREQRITNRVKALYSQHRKNHQTSVREICDTLGCSTSALYGHINGTVRRQPERMTNLVALLGGDPVEVLEDENVVQFLPAANDDWAEPGNHIDALLTRLSNTDICELMILAAPRMRPEDLATVTRELIEVGWNKASRPMEIPF